MEEAGAKWTCCFSSGVLHPEEEQEDLLPLLPWFPDAGPPRKEEEEEGEEAVRDCTKEEPGRAARATAVLLLVVSACFCDEAEGAADLVRRTRRMLRATGVPGEEVVGGTTLISRGDVFHSASAFRL
mmetsp:Transcript_36907/g.83970  ORF Transcript_36907/g.83970 Transcript_36907/m.83970 type:complete len:127 (+) Transcript_36907:116-496(+)